VTYFSNSRLFLFDATEWSRTATQKINKASKEKTSFHSTNSNNSRLSFLNHDSLTFDAPVGIGEYYLLTLIIRVNNLSAYVYYLKFLFVQNFSFLSVIADNPMDDSIITAAEPISGSDVVLNEINDQYRSQRSF